MATTTDRLGLHRFDMADSANLETAVGTTIDEIDERMVVASYGVYADRPAAGVPDRLYFASDRGTLFYDNGSTWTVVGPADDSITSAKIAADAVTSSEIATDAVGSAEIAANAVGSSEIAAHAVGTSEVADGAITDAKLANPNNAVFQLLSEVSTGYGDTSPFVSNTTKYAFTASGGTIRSGVNVNNIPKLFKFDDADYDAGLTQKLKLDVQVSANHFASGVVFKVGLYPIASVGGSGDSISYTLGTVVPGSEVTINATGLTDGFLDGSATFDIPADGKYAIGIVLSAAIGADANVGINAQLKHHSIP